MTKIVARSSWLARIDHMRMAAEALRNTAAAMGQKTELETRSERANAREQSDIEAADVVILASDVRIERGRFLDKPFSTDRVTKRGSEAVRNTKKGKRTPGGRETGEEPEREVSVSAGRRVVGIKGRSTRIEPASGSQSFCASTRGLKKPISQINQTSTNQE